MSQNSNKIYAQVLNGVVINMIVLNDDSLISLFSQGFDCIVRTDTLSPTPCIGFTYDGETFSPPLN